ncbi:hypothetical protein Q4555_09200 [Octadecabacter sp. 1_MG-2023]|uniref:hypothetical protein n=1 Tax=unclassified Octadecabacter TaxID=196158 RepID=UPI001C09795D|nr:MULTISPECIES: hypothetical protein [unclassified Octadecabacter]MBU2992396.1 hypothetical protein [Octadecabacter sp. B2R22]MDO6734847.1 hypothetical protein [Octadecabacter sp. 1_MG-2023]
MTKRAVLRLKMILEAERAALLTGDFATVETLAEEKIELSQNIGPEDRHELAALSGALAQNTTLLAAARDGVSNVLTALANQRAARQRLSSYDRSGKATTITQQPAKTERRF